MGYEVNIVRRRQAYCRVRAWRPTWGEVYLTDATPEAYQEAPNFYVVIAANDAPLNVIVKIVDMRTLLLWVSPSHVRRPRSRRSELNRPLKALIKQQIKEYLTDSGMAA